MKVPVIWQSYDSKIPPRGYWDHGIIEDLLNNRIWKPVYGLDFNHINGFDSFPEGPEGAVVVFPARAQVDHIRQLNDDLGCLKWAVLMLTGDEEGAFPVEQIKHPNIRIWVMSPQQKREYPKGTRFLGTGYPPQARKWIPEYHRDAMKRSRDWFFAGQITHERRQRLSEQLKIMKERKDMDGDFIATKGFTQGVDPSEYFLKLVGSKVAPCPSGPETPDSFRLFEALEAGCIPIADGADPKGNFDKDYWEWFFGEQPPFPVITNYEQLPGYTEDALKNWAKKSNRVFAWWQQKKRQLAYDLVLDIRRLAPTDLPLNDPKDLITVVIPSSPTALHPSTNMIEETIGAIRSKLPDSEIIITFDGVRSEQKHYRKKYEDYVRRTLWLCNNRWHNVLPIIFDKHHHQASMLRETLPHIRTPTLLYVEHDAPITPDYDFPWVQMAELILAGTAYKIRFHHEAHILPDHEHLMLSDPEVVNGIRMRRTMQWSQRPHLASVAWYRHLLSTYFHPKSRTMIEDVMHSVVQEDCMKDDLMGWYNHRIWVYTPEGNIKRSYHTDGRQTDPKYEMLIKKLR